MSGVEQILDVCKKKARSIKTVGSCVKLIHWGRLFVRYVRKNAYLFDVGIENKTGTPFVADAYETGVQFTHEFLSVRFVEDCTINAVPESLLFTARMRLVACVNVVATSLPVFLDRVSMFTE